MLKVHIKPTPFYDHKVLTPQFLTSHLIYVNKGTDMWLDNQIGQGERQRFVFPSAPATAAC